MRYGRQTFPKHKTIIGLNPGDMSLRHFGRAGHEGETHLGGDSPSRPSASWRCARCIWPSCSGRRARCSFPSTERRPNASRRHAAPRRKGCRPPTKNPQTMLRGGGQPPSSLGWMPSSAHTRVGWTIAAVALWGRLSFDSSTSRRHLPSESRLLLRRGHRPPDAALLWAAEDTCAPRTAPGWGLSDRAAPWTHSCPSARLPRRRWRLCSRPSVIATRRPPRCDPSDPPRLRRRSAASSSPTTRPTMSDRRPRRSRGCCSRARARSSCIRYQRGAGPDALRAPARAPSARVGGSQQSRVSTALYVLLNGVRYTVIGLCRSLRMSL